MKDESCRNCVYFCSVYSPEIDMSYHTYVCVVEHFHSLRKDFGAQPHAITVLHSSRCEMHTTRSEFDKMEILK